MSIFYVSYEKEPLSSSELVTFVVCIARSFISNHNQFVERKLQSYPTWDL